MADTGIFATGVQCSRKAGANASSTATASESLLNDFMTQAESTINVLTRFNWSDAYSGLDVDVKGILKEAKDEIQNLRDEVNETTGKNLQLEKDAKEMATHIFLRKKCDGLMEGQKTSIMSILEGSSKDEIEKKFDVVLESISTETKIDEEETEINEEETNTSTTEVDKETKKQMNESGGNPMMEQWKKMIRENKLD